MTKATDTIEIRRPDDWHLHVRDGRAMQDVIVHTAAQFARAIIMPNLKPPVVSAQDAISYRQRILAALPKEGVASQFQPLMTLYLTDNTPADEVARAKEAGVIGFKLYPAGATTNSDAGVTDIRRCDAVLAQMEKLDVPLLVHGEVTHSEIDVFDREAIFIEKILEPLRQRHPGLRIVFEHITTKQAVEYVRDADTQRFAKIAATVTPQHLLYNRNSIFSGGLRTHYYCLPVLKREEHRQAIVNIVASGNSRFFLGTDSAPHPKGAKESACGCAGCYTAWHAMSLYAEVFEQAGALDKLEGFASIYGPEFYGLPLNQGTLKLRRQTIQIPAEFPFGDEVVVPLRAGETTQWALVE
jgi:dihydroorotase